MRTKSDNIEIMIYSPEWLKNKKATKNSKNNDDKCFQYALTVALSYKQIKKHPKRTSKIKPFIDQYDWKEIDLPTSSNSWKNFELNNINILYVPYITKEIGHAYKSKYNVTRENQVILLMITDGEKWLYLAVKSLSGLLRGSSIIIEVKTMKSFFKDLKKHGTKIIYYEEKEMILLTKEEKKMHDKQKVCYICKKRI